jgi:hypothetical protein
MGRSISKHAVRRGFDEEELAALQQLDMHAGE